MSTLSAQLIHILSTALALVFSIGAIGLNIRTSKKFLQDTANKTLISKLRREVSENSGSLADLEERFTRFQKKEGMRVARSAKEQQDELAYEAHQIMSEAKTESEGSSDKLGLYKRMRGH